MPCCRSFLDLYLPTGQIRPWAQTVTSHKKGWNRAWSPWDGRQWMVVSMDPGSQAAHDQVLFITACLWALVSGTVSSCRVVCLWHVLLCPEYLQPGLLWRNQNVITISTNKWGKQVRPLLSLKSEPGHLLLFHKKKMVHIFLSIWNLTIIPLLVNVPVCIPRALEMWFNFLIFHFFNGKIQMFQLCCQRYNFCCPLHIKHPAYL